MPRSIKINTLSVYLNQGYSILLGILVIPFLYSIMGAEAFGVIGFFSVIQVFINILDSGLSPTLNRLVATGQQSKKVILKTIKSFESLTIGLGVVVLSLSYLFSSFLSENWFNSNSVLDELTITMLFSAAAFRLVSAIHKAALQGKEDFVWSNFCNVLFNTLRFPVCVIVMYFEPNITLYFFCQFLITVTEIVVLRLRVSRVFEFKFWLPGSFYPTTIKKNKVYMISVAFTALSSALIGNIDKLLFSNVLSLSEYGYFSVCVSISAAILTLGFPVGTVLMPRLTKLYVDGKIEAFNSLYFKFTLLVTAIVFPGGVVASAFSGHVLYVFTSDPDAVNWGKEILPWYILGNCFVILSAFQYYLQVATGNLQKHVFYNKVMLFLYVPFIVYLAYFEGVMWVAIFSFIVKFVSFLLWVPHVHNCSNTISHKRWLFSSPFVVVIFTPIFMFSYSPLSSMEDKLYSILEMSIVYLACTSLLFFTCRYINSKGLMR